MALSPLAMLPETSSIATTTCNTVPASKSTGCVVKTSFGGDGDGDREAAPLTAGVSAASVAVVRRALRRPCRPTGR